jgi:hypothetical protein
MVEGKRLLTCKSLKGKRVRRCGSAAGMGDDDTYPRELCTSNDIKREGGSTARIY